MMRGGKEVKVIEVEPRKGPADIVVIAVGPFDITFRIVNGKVSKTGCGQIRQKRWHFLGADQLIQLGDKSRQRSVQLQGLAERLALFF